MCTLNAPEEVFLAKKLIALHPWAGGVRYAKTGGEAMAIAVRIARASTNRDIVLFCGYHGWHDWYLSANLASDDALDGHHISGLQPNGVPCGLAGTALPFRYNDIDSFDALMETHGEKVAAVVMEPIRNDKPKEGFLAHIKASAQKQGAVLIFDEITAGFRLCCGGSHLVLGVEPDMAVFAKAMSNGYPVAAIIGTESVMDAAQRTFISSTYFTERVGLAAALSTIEIIEREQTWKHLERSGSLVKQYWDELAQNAGLAITISGINPLPHFSFAGDEALELKTYFTQEMLKKGYLASTAFYQSLAHDTAILNAYAEAVRDVFETLGILLKRGVAISEYLEGPVCHEGFGRLN
jgi:glutamate-1-semialdehyde aminotransferase